MLIRAPHLLLPTSARTTGARPADCRPRMRCHIYIGAEGCGKASIRGRLAGWWAWLAQSGSTWSHARKLVGHHTAASTRCKFWIRNAQNQHHIGDVQLGVGCPSIRVIANDWQCDIPDRLEGAGLNCQILRSIGRGRLIYGSRSGASCITTQAFAAAANSSNPPRRPLSCLSSSDCAPLRPKPQERGLCSRIRDLRPARSSTVRPPCCQSDIFSPLLQPSPCTLKPPAARAQ